MEIEVFTYRVAYAIAMTVMGAVAYRFKQHADEPETFLAMVVPVVIPIAQQAFSVGSGSNTSQVAPLNESSLLLMVVALSSSYFLGSVLAWAIDKKKNRKDQQNVDGDFRPFYVSFILWGALYGGLTVGARIREVNDGLLLIFSLGVLFPMFLVAGVSGSLSRAAGMRSRVLTFIVVCSGAIGMAMYFGARSPSMLEDDANADLLRGIIRNDQSERPIVHRERVDDAPKSDQQVDARIDYFYVRFRLMTVRCWRRGCCCRETGWEVVHVQAGRIPTMSSLWCVKADFAPGRGGASETAVARSVLQQGASAVVA